MAGFPVKFGRLCRQKDGIALHKLLQSSETGKPTLADLEATPEDVAAHLVRAWRYGMIEESLEAICEALRLWCARYISQKDAATWMLPPLLWLAARPRILAGRLDAAARSKSRYQEKVVEVFREEFQKLQRDRDRRGGALAIGCELLRLYFRLGQASQCTFLLAAMRQATGAQRLDMNSLPKALSVTLYFFWGKHCVLDGNVIEAEEKLGWALANCPPSAKGNRRRILGYLIPCRLRMGRYPTRGLLQRHSLDSLSGLVFATYAGDVDGFNRHLDKEEDHLISLGTYLVMEKLKLLVYRNLCARVHKFLAQKLDAQGKGEQRHKQDLMAYEHTFQWQDDCSPDETLCLLAHLMYIGAMRGYLSDEHRKIVFSKDLPFPPAAGWCANK